ncbi:MULTISPECIES: hypothetical protein [unclassified Neptuniibacter]|uniref:hypothetical protein n=1 Tax=unclassified Neptuniibacter TaxID=2630693 RepID=UPI0025F0705C|nr:MULTISPECIES: hypothetical protein [unclassified Neptuniibacter]|tara:strand:- start:3976 stop:4167 length:192 start_codon:yes stop_codon:yes gene_type:complete
MIKDSPNSDEKQNLTSCNIQEQPFKENYRCSNNLKEALQRSEQLLHKAEQLQKELSNRFYSIN